MDTVELVCLANSRKYRGKCVAGKNIANNEWIRPVSDKGKGEISVACTRFSGGSQLNLLDICKIPLKKHVPKHYQPENWLIDQGGWVRTGRFSEIELDEICDSVPSLWDNNHPSKDRISEDYIREHPQGSSLLFVKVSEVVIHSEEKRYENEVKRTLKAMFKYRGIRYLLSVTDPEVEGFYSSLNPGRYPISANRIYMCISLGEPYEKDGCCYKLVASIISVDEPAQALNRTRKAELMRRLKAWRQRAANVAGWPLYCIAGNRTLEEIVEKEVRTKAELLEVHGFGRKRLERYGDELIELLDDFYN